MLACELGRREIAQMLLEAGAKVDAANEVIITLIKRSD